MSLRPSLPAPLQKANTAWKNTRREVDPPGPEKGPFARLVDLPNSLDPSVPTGVP